MNRYNAYFCREQAGIIRNPWYTKVYRCDKTLQFQMFPNSLRESYICTTLLRLKPFDTLQIDSFPVH